MSKKISSKHNFEDCYLRHTYLRKTTYQPTREEVGSYSYICQNIAGKTFSTYRPLFQALGFDYIDIVRIADTNLAPFLEHFAIEVDQAKYDKFVDTFCDKNQVLPNDSDTLDKNKAIFTLLLKQRMETLVRVCRQKVRNVRGVPMHEFHIFCGDQPPTMKKEELIRDPHQFGYKKLDASVFRSIKKKADPENPLKFFFGGIWYVSIPTNYKPLDLLDFVNAGLDPRDTLHSCNPEDMILMSESNKKWEIKYKKFKRFSRETRIDMIKSFIDNNKGSPLFENELRTARIILNRMGE